MSKVIGKVLATEKNPSTMEEFYFWTKPELIMNPFDVIKVNHVSDSVTYGVIEEISHITDTANFLADYISSDFGDVFSTPITHRIGMNYVKARIVGNSKGIYTPVLNGCVVNTADKEEVKDALGLSSIKHPVPCGYLEMYSGSDSEKVKLPVNMDSKYLIGPEGAHMNISGISGLAAKTSYAMFLFKCLQDKCLKAIDEEDDEDVAFVIFNVKGKDLLAIDEPNLFDSDKERDSVFAEYKDMGVTPSPFSNVHYFYPYCDKNASNTFMPLSEVEKQIKSKKAHMYKYTYKQDKESLPLLFAGVDDSTQTMDSILNYIIDERGDFKNLDNWGDFLEVLDDYCKAPKDDKTILPTSWRKFKRFINKSIHGNRIFDSVGNANREIRLNDALTHIKKNEVYVIDIAKLDDDMQGYVFGNTVRTLYDLKSGIELGDDDYAPPSKIIVFIDELNKYASNDSPKNSPILHQVLDVAERGRSLGIILFAAEQFKSAIHKRVTGNCATFAYGRTNAIEVSDNKNYGFIPSVYKNMMVRLEQGEYIIQNPIFRSLLKIKFPKPIYRQFKQK